MSSALNFLFLNWKTSIRVTGTGNNRHKYGNGKPIIPLKRQL
jgi:hypothetical protein